MPMIGLYEITETLGTNGRYLIYRAKASNSAEKVLIKTLRPNEIERGDFAQLQHEYGLLQRLGAHNGYFPSVIGWAEPENPLNLILKDEGFVFLSEALTQKPLDLDVFFPIAIQLAKMLTEIHNAGIIFKNINPQSIWLRPTDKAVQIADFSIATELNRTMVPGDPPRLLQGSLEYIAIWQPLRRICTNVTLSYRRAFVPS
ncbi:MAG: ATP-binding region ATPase domain protein [Gammaproteobacteria bacterium]|nr:ATP-binding region ATPase domain protein [Gammaproteobacteria bacterium]